MLFNPSFNAPGRVVSRNTSSVARVSETEARLLFTGSKLVYRTVRVNREGTETVPGFIRVVRGVHCRRRLGQGYRQR